ncbi:hypothetical protein ACOSQ4_027417 [Xanthoceras sorbifolium]
MGTLTVPSISNISTVETFSPFGGNLSHSSVIKLDRYNHLLWKSIVFLIIHGYKLYDYMFGTKPCPPKFLLAITISNYPSLNPAYEHWVVQDQLLLGWLLSFISESILTKVVGLTTFHKVWTKLEIVFANQSMEDALNYWQYLDREYDIVLSVITHQKTAIGWSEVEAILITQKRLYQLDILSLSCSQYQSHPHMFYVQTTNPSLVPSSTKSLFPSNVT